MVELIWNRVSGASKYELTVSTSEDMSNVVYRSVVNTNTAKIDNLDIGDYYYTVKAMSISKLYNETVLSEVESFRVDGRIRYDGVEITQKNETHNAAEFKYTSSSSVTGGVVILAEKTADVKLLNTELRNIPDTDANTITITAEYDKNNVMECCLWQDMRTLLPLCQKGTTQNR